MKKILLLIVATSFLSSCGKEAMNPSFENKILGNWLVVDENNNLSVVEWGLFYVSSIKLYADKSFKIGLFKSIDDDTIPKTGAWVLNSNKDSITFYSLVNDIGLTLRDTTSFNISIGGSGKLTLRDKWTSIPHVKWDN